MHQTSPGVERAVVAAREWANRLSSEPVRLAHLVLALLDEEEGRPAVLLEHVGLSVPHIRERLAATESLPAPQITGLFNAARNWSIAHRHDPEFLTDAFLLAVLTTDAGFRATAAALGFAPEVLERILTKTVLTSPPEGEVDEALRAGKGGEFHEVEEIASPPAASKATRHPPSGRSKTSGRTPTVFEPNATSDADAARILDASFNRAREAARVLEDYCRFALDDRFLTEQVKELRHGLAALAQKLPGNVFLAARETLRDVGTTATAGSEYERTSPAHVAVVNLKRLQESLRSVEEFGKVFGPQLGQQAESLRYRAYTLERAASRLVPRAARS